MLLFAAIFSYDQKAVLKRNFVFRTFVFRTNLNHFATITSFVFQLVWTQWGNHSSKMFSQEAVDHIMQHDTKDPMFLYLCYQAVHSSNRKEDALQAPQYWINKFRHITNIGRRKYAAMVAYMDYGIGKVII